MNPIPVNNFIQIKTIEEPTISGAITLTAEHAEKRVQKAEVIAVSESSIKFPEHHPPMQVDPGDTILIRKGMVVSYGGYEFLKQEDLITKI